LPRWRIAEEEDSDVAVDDIVAVVDDRSDDVSPIFIRPAIRRANAIFYSSETNVMERREKPRRS